MTTPTPAVDRGALHPVLARWPSALGLLAACLFLATGPDRETVAITVCVAALCYLTAAAFGRPWLAWVMIIGGSVLVVLIELAGLDWWVGLAVVTLALVVVGLLGGVPRFALTAQAAAMIGFGGLAVAALFVAPRAGMIMVGVVLASHAVWDVVHYRRNQVVPRSLAEFCIVLDVPFGIAFVALALAG